MNTLSSNALALNIPGVMTAASLLHRTAQAMQIQSHPQSLSLSHSQSQHQPRSMVELTVGVDPAQLLEAAAQHVKTPALRNFFHAVVQEPEIYQTLTSLTTSSQTGRMSCPIQPLRRAAELASYWCASGAQERDVLFVATVLRGTQALIGPMVMGSSRTSDVMFTLVRKALHRLDEQSPRCANLLRLSLNWGNVDDIDDFYVPRLQQAVQKALGHVNLKAMVSATPRCPDIQQPTEPRPSSPNTMRHQQPSMAQHAY